MRPIVQLGGDTGFGEIFLDDVFVPDRDVIGTPHQGWRAAMSTSSNERGMSLRSPARFLATAERVVRLWQDRGSPAEFADRVADGWIKAQAYRLQTFGTVTRLATGGELGAESSVTKVFWSDLDVELHQTALDILAADGELAGPWTEGCCSRWAARSTPAPTRFSATSSPSGYWGCRARSPGARSEIRARRTAAGLRSQHRRRARRGRPARGGARLGGGRHRARPQGVGAAGQPRRHRAGRAGEIRRHRGRADRSGGGHRAARALVCARPGGRIHRRGTGIAGRRRARRTLRRPGLR